MSLFHSDAEIRAIVFSKSEEFIQYLNVEELIPHLKIQRLLTKAEEVKLNRITDRCLANKKLILDILPSKSRDAFLLFFEALKCEKNHKGHEDLVKLIQQE